MNEHQVKQRAAAEAQRRFLQALSAGQVGVIDRFGRRIEVGCAVLWHPPFDLMFDVTAVSPILDHRKPAGLMNVTLTVTVPMDCPVNVPRPDFVVVRLPHAEQTDSPTQTQAGQPSDHTEAPGASETDPSGVDRNGEAGPGLRLHKGAGDLSVLPESSGDVDARDPPEESRRITLTDE